MATVKQELEQVLITIPRKGYSDQLKAFQKLADAKRALDIRVGKYSNATIRVFREAVDEAEKEASAFFTEALTIEQAEVLYGYLGGAIVHAKVWRGDFNKGDDE